MMIFLRHFAVILSAIMSFIVRNILNSQHQYYRYFALGSILPIIYILNKMLLGFPIPHPIALGLLFVHVVAKSMITGIHFWGKVLIANTLILFLVKKIASRYELHYAQLALANIRSYGQSFEVRASQKVSALYNQLHLIADSYLKGNKHAHYYSDGFFYKITGLGWPQKGHVESFLENHFMQNESFDEKAAQPIPVIQMLVSPLRDNPQPVNLQLFHHTRRVYSIVDAPAFNIDGPYTVQVVTKDILQKEIAAREMATLLGLDDLIPPFAVYRAPQGLSAYENHNNIPRRMEGVELTPESLLTIEQINLLPDEPDVSFIMLRQCESAENIKKMVYQANFVEQATPEERDNAVNRLDLLDVEKTQKLIILQYILGVRSDLNDLAFSDQNPIEIKSLYHTQIMPENNYACPGTHLMNNSAVLPQSTREWHPVAHVSSENMRSLQLPILALPAGTASFNTDVKIAMAAVSPMILLKYHEAKNLFTAQSVTAQFQRFRVLQKELSQQSSPRSLLTPFQSIDMQVEFDDSANTNEAYNLFYTHMSLCPMTPYCETKLIFEQWAFDAGVERQKRQYQRLLCFDGRSSSQAEKLLNNYYHKEIRDALKRQARR